MSILQLLEQEAYHAVLLVFATQELDWSKESLLSQLRSQLHISDPEHRHALDSALADPRVQAIRRGEDNVPVSFAGRPIQRPSRASSPPLPSTYSGGRGPGRINSQRGRTSTLRVDNFAAPEAKKGPGRPPGRAVQPISPLSGRRQSKRPMDDEPIESPFLQHHPSGISEYAEDGRRASMSSRGRGRGKSARRISSLDLIPSYAQQECGTAAAGGPSVAQHMPIVRGLLDMYLSSGDAALLEASLQRLNAREREVQHEIQVAQKLQGSFTDEAEMRSLQLQDLEAAERCRRNELVDQQTLIAINEQ